MAVPQRLESGKRLADDDTLNGILATPQWQTTTGIVASSASLSADTPVLNLGSNVVSSGSGAANVALPVAVPGSVIFVANASGGSITINAAFNSGDFINATSTTTTYTLADNKRLILIAVDTVSWYTILTA